jgi:3D (Asp-Asp-Asp) domain-containing protein
MIPMAQFGCGSSRCTCVVQAGPNITVTGNGSGGAPYVIGTSGGGGGTVTCDDVRPCLSAGPGVDYDPATGVIAAEPTVVQAGANVTVTGAGSTASPYVVAADPVTCDDVRPCLSAGPGVDYDPATGVIAAEPTVVQAGANVTVTGTGSAANPYIVNAAGGGTGGVTCADVRPCLVAGPGIDYDVATGTIAAEPTVVQAGANVTVTGAGSTASPYVVAADPVTCDDVRPCLSAGPGVDYDPATGVIAAEPITAACGLEGDGSAGAPLQVAVGAWPYPCSPDTSGGVIVCGTDGVLRGEPRGRATFVSTNEQRDYADLPVPAGFDVVADTFTAQFTNPDACRPALLIVEREADVDFNLPAGAGAASGQDTDETFYVRNTGTTTIFDAHAQSTKLFQHTLALAPGATATVNFPVTIGRGSAGATYNRIQVFIRGLMISL